MLLRFLLLVCLCAFVLFHLAAYPIAIVFSSLAHCEVVESSIYGAIYGLFCSSLSPRCLAGRWPIAACIALLCCGLLFVDFLLEYHFFASPAYIYCDFQCRSIYARPTLWCMKSAFNVRALQCICRIRFEYSELEPDESGARPGDTDHQVGSH